MGYRRTANVIFVAAAPLEVGLQAPEGGVTGLGLAGRAVSKKVAVTGGVASLGLGGRNAAASRIVAQTGQTALGLGGRAALTAVVASTGSFTHVTVTRDYDLATGEAPTGVVYFTLSTWLENNGVTLVPTRVAAPLDSLGQISVSLAANNDVGTTPADSYYTVCEFILGQPERCYRMTVPHALGPGGDVTELAGGYGTGGYGTSPYGG